MSQCTTLYGMLSCFIPNASGNCLQGRILSLPFSIIVHLLGATVTPFLLQRSSLRFPLRHVPLLSHAR
jgi:hypothetical protein